MKLNLGCGTSKQEGYVNVDREPEAQPDVIHDLESIPWPFPDASAELIEMSHVLEHLGQTPKSFFAIIKELYRVLEPNGELRIRVPHPRSDNFLGDPTHVRPILPQTMELFSRRLCLDRQERGVPNTPLALYLDVDFEMLSVSATLTQHWLERYRNGLSKEQIDEAMATHNNVAEEFLIVMRKVQPRP